MEEIKLKVPPNSYVKSRYEGNEHVRYTWRDDGIEVREAYLYRSAEAKRIGEVIVVPFDNIVYTVVEP